MQVIFQNIFLDTLPPAPSMQPESSDGFASVGTILPEERAALLPGGSFRFERAFGLGRSHGRSIGAPMSVHSLPHCSQRHVFDGSTPSRIGSSAPHAGTFGRAEFGQVRSHCFDNLARNGLLGNFARFSESIGCDQHADGAGREQVDGGPIS